MNMRERVQLLGLPRGVFPVVPFSGSQRFVRALALLVGCSCVPGSALAQDDSGGASKRTRVTLEFSGVGDCVEASLLEEELVRRAGDLVIESAGEVDARVSVRLSTRSDGYGAEVVVTRAEGQETHRTIAGGSCAEVVEGAALIIAVSLPRRPEKEPPPPIESSSPVSPVSEKGAPGFRFGGGIDAAVVGEVAPQAMIGFEVFADVAPEDTGFVPAFRLGLRHAARAGISVPPGEASFGLDAAFAEVCPVAAPLFAPVRLRLCALGVVGVLSATSTGLERSAGDRHPWVALGGGARAELALSPVFSLELAGSAEATVTPGRFLIDEESVHRTPDLGLRAAAGLVVRFR